MIVKNVLNGSTEPFIQPFKLTVPPVKATKTNR